MKNAYPRSF